MFGPPKLLCDGGWVAFLVCPSRGQIDLKQGLVRRPHCWICPLGRAYSAPFFGGGMPGRFFRWVGHAFGGQRPPWDARSGARRKTPPATTTLRAIIVPWTAYRIFFFAQVTGPKCGAGREGGCAPLVGWFRGLGF